MAVNSLSFVVLRYHIPPSNYNYGPGENGILNTFLALILHHSLPQMNMAQGISLFGEDGILAAKWDLFNGMKEI